MPTSVRLQWPVWQGTSELTAPYYSYEVQFRSASTNYETATNTHIRHNNITESGADVIIPDLISQTEYTFRIVPFRDIDVETFSNKKQEAGNSSQEVTVTTTATTTTTTTESKQI